MGGYPGTPHIMLENSSANENSPYRIVFEPRDTYIVMYRNRDAIRT